MNTLITKFSTVYCLFILFISFIPRDVSGQPQDQNSYRLKTIVVDAGHGGKDGVTHGLISKEKDVALKVALELGEAIKRELPEVKVIYTRDTDDFIELYERIAIANKNKADLFISIHCNSMPIVNKKVVSHYVKNKSGKRVPVYKTVKNQNTSAHGSETFVSGFNRLGEQDVAMRENASMLLEENYQENYLGFDPKDPESYIVFSLMKNAFRDQSIKLASLVQQEYAKSGRTDRGVKEQSLAVLAPAGMPAILTEIGFITNPEEERYMNSETGRKEIANNILKAIKTYKRQVED